MRSVARTGSPRQHQVHPHLHALRRYLYNPDTAPDFYHRYLKQAFRSRWPGARILALAASSRILPLVTTACALRPRTTSFWPEMLTPVSILPLYRPVALHDSPAPHKRQRHQPLDPQLFTTIDQARQRPRLRHEERALQLQRSDQWLDAMVKTQQTSLASTQGGTTSFAYRRNPPSTRMHDILILDGLGQLLLPCFPGSIVLLHRTTDQRLPGGRPIHRGDARSPQCMGSHKRAAAYAYTPAH